MRTTILRRLPALPLLSLVGALAAAQALAGDAQGLLYGRVTSRAGTVYEGRLRWGGEEASWVDLFNSAKAGNPWREVAGHDRTPRRIEVLGVPLPFASNPADEDRQFIARFGDIAKIAVGDDDKAMVTMKSGTVYPVVDGSNDVGADIHVWDAKAGEVTLRWERIATIEFLPTPANLQGPARLSGTVRSREGDFTGTLQWNMRQALVTDTLRGEDADALKEIVFADIASIERRSDASSRVVLRDGKRFELADRRDVGRGNDGIFVDDPRWGRVLVSWGAFERVDFTRGTPSPPYEAFPPGRPLHGKVTGADGKAHGGRIVFDLDESETWEFLNGNHLPARRAHPLAPWDPHRDDPAGIQFNVPIPLVAAIEPIDDESARLYLRDGRETVLEGETDVGEWNGGMLIYENGAGKPTYIPWKDVRRVEFDR
jgi:hypothetical protein